MNTTLVEWCNASLVREHRVNKELHLLRETILAMSELIDLEENKMLKVLVDESLKILTLPKKEDGEENE